MQALPSIPQAVDTSNVNPAPGEIPDEQDPIQTALEAAFQHLSSASEATLLCVACGRAPNTSPSIPSCGSNQIPFLLMAAVHTARLQDSAFAGLFSAVVDKESIIQPEDVEDEINGEGETIPNLEKGDFEVSDEDVSQERLSQWRKTITGASKAVTDGTDSEYRRYAN
ncbi:hypothetical protein CPB83DRAFT_896291 [Crepidotus variabilis]|uniref:Uncharacterized protein n=1 Tax=Crepidotus variabilis TaxID=179855 RepID=A0A9P6JMN1_9AGAR|nr:hypothetical protein CPB83DRAFT_896291 [Crepidotus variabilis]